jgi:hypothetical protein
MQDRPCNDRPALLALALAGGALPFATSAMAQESDAVARELAELRAANAALAEKVESLERSVAGDDWLTEARATEIRGIVTDVLADAAVRDSLAGDGAGAGWDRAKGGFYIESGDGNFLLNLRGQFQARFVYDSRNTVDSPTVPPGDEWGFEMRRVRLHFAGHVVDPSWTFQITPVWGRIAAGNLVGTANGGLDNAWVRKDLGDGWGVKIGQFQPLFTREESISSAQQQAVERTTLNEIFSVRYSQGVQLEFGGREEDRFRAAAFYGDGFRAGATLLPVASALPAGTFGGTANTTFNTNMAKYAFSGRVEMLGDGSWSLMRDFSSFRGKGSGWLVGVGAMAQALEAPTIAPLSPEATDSMWQVLADASFKFDGSSLFFGGFYRHVALAGEVATRDGGTSDGMDQFGFIAQGGVFVSDRVELFARYEWGDTDTDKFRTALTGIHYENASMLTVGLNWFVSGDHSLKWSTDFGYAFDPVGDFTVAGADWLLDVAATTGDGTANDGQWVLRSQFQWLF